MNDTCEISPTCEVGIVKQCGLPTVGGYPAMGGGWMALCAIHVGPHESYVVPVEDIRAGIGRAMLANGSRG
ncbi:MAG: hypothetical protein ACJ8AK_02885 [Gemmatimonadaceae bacterium]